MLGKRRYKKLFIIATEGEKTEPQYFNWFDNQSVIRVKCLISKHSSPTAVLKKMQTYLVKERLSKSDEAWLVVDKDCWSDDQLDQLHNWAQTAGNYHFALSNPKFEYWLLLHFEDGKGVRNSHECSERLKKYLPDYDKSIDVKKITMKMVNEAINRAKDRDNHNVKWPQNIGTTVYKLVENILKTQLLERE